MERRVQELERGWETSWTRAVKRAKEGGRGGSSRRQRLGIIALIRFAVGEGRQMHQFREVKRQPSARIWGAETTQRVTSRWARSLPRSPDPKINSAQCLPWRVGRIRAEEAKT